MLIIDTALSRGWSMQFLRWLLIFFILEKDRYPVQLVTWDDLIAKQNTQSNPFSSPVTMHNAKRFYNLYGFALLLLVLVNAVTHDSNSTV